MCLVYPPRARGEWASVSCGHGAEWCIPARAGEPRPTFGNPVDFRSSPRASEFERDRFGKRPLVSHSKI